MGTMLPAERAAEAQPVEAEGPTWDRLEDQIDWYSRRSSYNQRMFKWLKIAQVASAAAVPVAAGLDGPVYVTGGLGAVIVVLEGLQQMNQYHQNWITYRSTAEALKHEKYLFLARAGPYGNAGDATALLAERVEGLVSQEHAKWVSGQEEAGKGAPSERTR
jgi:Protein of unknown function (DUF4231)